MDHAARVARLRESAVTVDPPVDALLVTEAVDVRWLTGFSGSNGAVLVPVTAEDDVLLCTDGRYVTQAGEEAPDLPLVVARRCGPALAEQAAGRGLVRLGVDAARTTLAAAEAVRAAGVQVVPHDPLLPALRAKKDDDELALLRRACEITVAALAASLEHDRWAGVSEREVAARLEHRMRVLGAEAAAFETIVGSGPHAAVPHHRPGDRPLAPGDLVVVDMGARVGGYHADLSRTLVVGPPAGWQTDLHALVASAQRAGREALVPGAACAEVDAAARRVIEDAGHGPGFAHGLGHGVGLEIHESPLVGPGAAGSIAPRMTVTVEPGVYLPGRGGVRIEDTLVVGDDAAGTTSMTILSRDLHVLA